MAVEDILSEWENMKSTGIQHESVSSGASEDIESDPIVAEFRQMQANAKKPSVKEDSPTMLERAGDIFTGDLRQTRETESLGEIGNAPEMNELSVGAFKASLGTLFSGDETATQDILRKNIGAEFRKDEKGNLIAMLPSGEYLVNAPGLSGQDVARGAAQFLGFLAPASRGAKVAESAIAKGAPAVATRLGVGGAVGGGSEAAMQGIEQLTGSDQGFRAGDIGLAAALGGATEASIPALSKQFSAYRKAPQEIVESEQAAKEVQSRLSDVAEGQKQTGIELLEPQATQLPSQVGAMRALGEIAPTSQKVATRLQKQNKQAYDAVESFLNDIAPEGSVSTAAQRTRGAAQQAIESAKQRRRDAASPLYKQAFDEGKIIDQSSINDQLKSTLESYVEGGKIHNSLSKYSKMLSNANGDIRKLHNLQVEIGDAIESAKDTGIGRTEQRELTSLRKLISDTIKEQSETYADAAESFAKSSPEVTQLQEGVIGRLANVSDAQLKQISGILFDPQQSNPQVVRDSINIIKSVDPDAVPALMRTYLEQTIAKKPGLSDTVSTENVPAKLQSALFRTKKQRDMFNAVANDEQKKRARYLDMMLKSASTGRSGGSDTAMKTEFIKQLRDNSGTSLAEKIFNPKQTFTDWRKEARFNSVANQLADALVEGKWDEQWKEIFKYKPGSKDSYKALAQVLSRTSEDGGSEER